MAKQTSKNTVSITRNGHKKDISKAQWDSMKANKATYGWSLTSELSDEVLEKDKSIETSKISELEGKVSTLSTDNETLKSENEGLKTLVSEKDSKISELEAQIEILKGTGAELKETPKPQDNGKAGK